MPFFVAFLSKSQLIKVVPWQTNSIFIIVQNSKALFFSTTVYHRLRQISPYFFPALFAIRKISASDMLPAVYSSTQLYVGEIVQHR